MSTRWLDGRPVWRHMLRDNPDAWAAVRLDSIVKATAALPPAGGLGLPNTFVVGSYATRITIRDQQWLGLEVAEAVARLYPDDDPDVDHGAKGRPRTGRGRNIAIIGGGFAGTAAALWLTLKHKLPVVLFEKAGLLSSVANSNCLVHTTLWDWPACSDRPEVFPKPVDELLKWPMDEPIRAGQLLVDMRRRITNAIRESGCGRLLLQPIGSNDLHAMADGIAVRAGGGEWVPCRALLLCVGFGEGRQLVSAGGPGPAADGFWGGCGNRPTPGSHLVIGGGDTALMTAIELVTRKQPLELLTLTQALLGPPFHQFGEDLMKADLEYEIRRGLGGRWPCNVIRHEDALIRLLVCLHDAGLWQTWREQFVRPDSPKVSLGTRRPLHESRSSRVNRALCMLLHAASRYYPPTADTMPELTDRDFELPALPEEVERDVRNESEGDADGAVLAERKHHRLLHLRNLPLTDLSRRDIDSYHQPLPGLSIATGFDWVTDDEVPRVPHRLHLLRRADGFATVGEYETIHVCIGPEAPVLLRQLEARIDLSHLRTRQRDWQWS